MRVDCKKDPLHVIQFFQACSTCHLIFKQEDYAKIPEPPTDEELDMLVGYFFNPLKFDMLACLTPIRDHGFIAKCFAFLASRPSFNRASPFGFSLLVGLR